MTRRAFLTEAEIAARRARIGDDIETPELPTRIEDRAFDAPTITDYEFRESGNDPRIPDRSREPGNTGEAMSILGITKQSLYETDLPFKIIDGHRHYDLTAVRARARARTMPPGCVRLKDAAKILGVSKNTVGLWTRDGKLPCVMVGKVRAYRIADLDMFATTR